ncbi:hypothetical protein MPHL43072_22065 [Mycolicibacterium phlei DSM 43072]|nr:hypothetical protein MPHL43072_22065 [Mycolicibacterium phlei DSM 43072]
MVHHEDYLTHRSDIALCGLVLTSPDTVDPAAATDDVCPGCEARLIEYHLAWWRERAEAATAELEELRARYRALTGAADEPPRPQPVAIEVDASSLLGRARTELLELCRQFDGALPYWRLKNTMQAFNDRLSTDERIQLAAEIGEDGSLIRWCTSEAQRLGWTVTDSPVQAENQMSWDAWTQDLYQTPKRSRWRLGRARSQDG